jgi:hypothetical protein
VVDHNVRHGPVREQSNAGPGIKRCRACQRRPSAQACSGAMHKPQAGGKC